MAAVKQIDLSDDLSLKTIAKIKAEKVQFPAPGDSKFFNFDFCLALLKTLQFHITHEEFLLREKQAPIRRKCL